MCGVFWQFKRYRSRIWTECASVPVQCSQYKVTVGKTWHLDEVFCKINGQLVYLWRAVDQEGEVLDILVQSRRNAKAAKRFFKKLLKGSRYSPRRLVTDKLPSYTSAHREMIPAVEHRRGKSLNNRAENSHQPTRERERRTRRFKSMKHAQRFLSTHGQESNHFRCGRHLMRACHYRNKLVKQFKTWRRVCGLVQPVTIDHRLLGE